MRPSTAFLAEAQALHDEGLRFCGFCSKNLPLSDFGKYTRGVFGLRKYCKSCTNEYNRESYHRTKDPEHIRQKSIAAYYRKSPEYRKRERWRLTVSTYGLTIDDWTDMLIDQAGRCAVCSDPMERPNVDHCHDTGDVRGLLCRGCNQGLGCFRDRPSALRAAAEYLVNSVQPALVD